MRIEFTRQISRLGSRLYVSIPKHLYQYIDEKGYYRVILEPIIEKQEKQG